MSTFCTTYMYIALCCAVSVDAALLAIACHSLQVVCRSLRILLPKLMSMGVKFCNLEMSL